MTSGILKAIAGLATAVAVTGCDEPRTAPQAEPSSEQPTQVVVGKINGYADPMRPAMAPQFAELPIVKDGVSNSNPPGTIEVFSTFASPSPPAFVDNTQCNGAQTYWTRVRIKSYYQEELRNVYVVFTDIHGGTNTVCDRLSAKPAGISDTSIMRNDGTLAAINAIPGILDYTNNGSLTLINQSSIGSYTTVRPQVGNTMGPNPASYPLPNSDKIWAFPTDGQTPFSYEAYVVASVRPAPAELLSPYVDAGGDVYFFSHDSSTVSAFGPGIADTVNVQLYTDAAMTTSAGPAVGGTVDLTATAPTFPGLLYAGFANTGPATTGRPSGTRLYAKLQNQWGSAPTLYGTYFPEPKGNTVTVTNACTVNSGDTSVANTTFPISPDPNAIGVEIEVHDGGGRPDGYPCTATPNASLDVVAKGTYLWDAGQRPTVFPRGSLTMIPSTFTFAPGYYYCYVARNLFRPYKYASATYHGTYSDFGSMVGP